VTGDALRILLQATTIASLIWAAGGGLYLLALGGRSPAADSAARMATRVAALMGVAAVTASTLLQLLDIGGDWSAAFDPFTLQLFGEISGVASGLRVSGLLVLTLWLSVGGPPLVGVSGVAVVIASFAFSGHVVSHEPSALLRLVVAGHVCAAAFWLGALFPLRAAALGDPPEAAARLMDAFAVRATAALLLLVAAGFALAILLSGQPPWRWLETAWGRGLLIKLGLVAVLLGFAAFHRFMLTENLRRGRPGAGRTFAASIVAETVVALMIVIVTVSFASQFSPTGE
jgi:putative copper export protein